MSAQDASPPAVPPVEPHAYREEPGHEHVPWYRDGHRLLRTAAAALLVVAGVLTDLAPAAVATFAVVVGSDTVHERTRRDGARWWTVVELVMLVVAAALLLVLTGAARDVSVGRLVGQLAVGAGVGAALVVLTTVVGRTLSRRRASAPPTGV